jgi:hypothetical protein
MRHTIIILAIAAMAMPAWAQAPRTTCTERFDVHGTMMAPPPIINRQAFHQDPPPSPPIHRMNSRARESRPCFMT